MAPIRKPTIPIAPKAPSNASVLKNFDVLEKYLKAKNVTIKDFLTKMASIFESFTDGKKPLFPYITKLFKTANKKVAIAASSTSTSSNTNTANSNHEFVEMGDGLKWATCNIGASKPEEVGDYIAWGETEPFYSSYEPLVWKEGCGYYGYEYNRLFVYDIKTNNSFRAIKYDAVDGKKVLEPVDDAASVNWGGDWRIPTEEEWCVLLDENKFTWAAGEKNGVKGYTVTSKVKGFVGNSIFLPAGAYCVGEATLGKGWKTKGYYWSSTKLDNSADRLYAIALYFSTDSPSQGIQHFGCFNGLPVRPVCK